jgi:hypothetical protein
LRREALAADGKVFPALAADVMLTPAGEQITPLAVAGTCRRPPGRAGAGLDQAIVRQCAAAMIRGFMARIACALVRPAGATGPAGARPTTSAVRAGAVTVRSTPWSSVAAVRAHRHGLSPDHTR